MIAALLDHLWQSSLVALLAALLTLTVRRNGARVRFWLWFAASVKFLLPFALLAQLGEGLSRLFPHAIATPAIIQPALRLTEPARMLPAQGPDLLPWLCGAWVLGLALVLGLRLAHGLKLRLLLADARELPAQPVRVKTSSSLLEPGLVGLFRPAVVLPLGLLAHLAPGELASILAHEASHLRRRDNLTAAIHMLVEAIFWFWPPVWLIGARLIAERERACDESVLAAGHDPLTYAQGILKVCRYCLQSPLACVPGVSGSDLGRRMERIMVAEAPRGMDGPRAGLLLLTGLMVVSLPVLAGFATSPLAVPLAMEVTRRAAQIQTQIQAAVAAPLAALAPDDVVPVVRAMRPARPKVIATAVPAPQVAPVVTDDMPIAQPVAPTPVPAAVVVAEIAPTPVQQAVLAIRPTGEGDPEAITCRVPQTLPGSRLPGPAVCNANKVWASLRSQGKDITADGRTVVAIRSSHVVLDARSKPCPGVPVLFGHDAPPTYCF